MNDEPISLSAVLITQDAGASLARCLGSLRDLVDEIVVVDSGSIDDTLEIAARYGAVVVEQPWLGFGPQKRFAVCRAKHDWVLCVDSDEWLSEPLRAALRRFRQAPEAAKVYRVARANRFMGRFLRHGEAYPDYNVRLFHRDYAAWSNDVVHEKVVVETAVATLRGDLLHDSAQSLDDYLNKQNRYTTLQATKLISEDRPVSAVKAVVGALFRFFRGYVVRLGFLDGFPGLAHTAIAASNTFYKYAKSIELRRRSKSDE